MAVASYSRYKFVFVTVSLLKRLLLSGFCIENGITKAPLGGQKHFLQRGPQIKEGVFRGGRLIYGGKFHFYTPLE